MDTLETIEIALRNYGQRQALSLGSTAIRQLQIICDRIWSLRIEAKNETHVGK